MFEERSGKLERIDTGDYTAREYDDFLRDIRHINRFVGDKSALKNTLLREIRSEDLKNFSVLDVGAGSGELLRVVAEFVRKSKRETSLTGLELNARSARAILEESKDFTEITAVRGDALNLPFNDDSFDFVICSLFTHHFTDENVVKILGEMSRVSRRKIYVIDLHRHRAAYFLYTKILSLVIRSSLVREDGALSILRSFKPDELEKLAQNAGLKNINVERHLPFRLVLEAEAFRVQTSERPLPAALRRRLTHVKRMSN